jgi:hypothetical protein
VGGEFSSESFRPFFISRCWLDKSLGSEDPSYMSAGQGHRREAGADELDVVDHLYHSFTNSMPRRLIQVVGSVEFGCLKTNPPTGTSSRADRMITLTSPMSNLSAALAFVIFSCSLLAGCRPLPLLS